MWFWTGDVRGGLKNRRNGPEHGVCLPTCGHSKAAWVGAQGGCAGWVGPWPPDTDLP